MTLTLPLTLTLARTNPNQSDVVPQKAEAPQKLEVVPQSEAAPQEPSRSLDLRLDLEAHLTHTWRRT